MHITGLAPSDANPATGIYLGENAADLEARVNVDLLTLHARLATLWDADITNVGGGRMFAVSLTEQLNGDVPSDINPDLVRAFIFFGETPEALMLNRSERYLTDPNIAGKKLYLSKIAGGSNGRLWWNLQIIGGFTPA